MMQQSDFSNRLGQDGFSWWLGVVEDVHKSFTINEG
jgi:hypothetical protein